MAKRIELYRNCLECDRPFKTRPSILTRGSGKYCSLICRSNHLWKNPDYANHMSEVHKGKKSNNALEIWRLNGGVPSTKSEHLFNEKNSNWKGDLVGYAGLHMWVKRHLGKPEICEFCGMSGLVGRQIHWANKSHKYKRELTDWIRLCAKCHKQYDISYKNQLVTI